MRAVRFSFTFKIIFCVMISFSYAADLPTNTIAFSALSSYDTAIKNPVIFNMPKELQEISGIAMTDDGRLFTHDDELGVIYQIDYNTGSVVKRFSLGIKPVHADFEDIAIVKDKFFLVASNGKIFKFSEGKNSESVAYEVYVTPLSSRNNIEGLCYDVDTYSLLLACKQFPGEGYDDSRAVYSFSLKKMKLEKEPRFLISLNELKNKFGMKGFKPSSITRHPQTGTFFILSAHEPSIIELSSRGEILGCVKLPESVHRQPEGITFAPDLTLFISNEGVKHGTIVRYPVKP